MGLHFRELPDSSEGQRLREAGPPWEARWGQGDARETVVWWRGTDLVPASNSEQFVPIPGGLCDCRQAAPHVSSSQKIHIRKLY